MRIRKDHVVKHKVSGAYGTVSSVDSKSNQLSLKGVGGTFRLSDFTRVKLPNGRHMPLSTANTLLKAVNTLRVSKPSNRESIAVNTVIDLINTVMFSSNLSSLSKTLPL